MRSQVGMAVICGMVFALLSSLTSAAGRQAGDACSFLNVSRAARRQFRASRKPL